MLLTPPGPTHMSRLVEGSFQLKRGIKYLIVLAKYLLNQASVKYVFLLSSTY